MGLSNQKQPFNVIIKLGRAKTFFKTTLIVFILKNNVIYT